MTDARVQAAAHNNAHWCEAVCAAHGRPGALGAACWVNPHETPPFYPNLVTLLPDPPEALVHGALLGLAGCGFERGVGVKDSFDTLDLSPLGFRTLTPGRWVWRDVSQPPSASPRFASVCDEAGLDAWERAWREAQGEGLEGWPGAVFARSLLRHPDVTFLAAHRGPTPWAGAVAHRSGDVVGLSNLFASGRPVPSVVGGCVAAAMAAYPGLPLTGWESAPELAAQPSLGFEAIGPLRVWILREPRAGTS